MTDTAQPQPAAAETDPASRDGALRAAADAFKISLGQIPASAGTGAPARELPRRGEDGRFLSAGGDADGGEDNWVPEHVRDDEGGRIEAPGDPDEAEAGAESQGDVDGEAEAGDEPQPSDPPLPKSWPAEQAELWRSLPPEAQAVIAGREGQRDAAVNAKFQEAANLRKAHEAEIDEAKRNCQAYAEAAELVLSLVQPQMPPRSMLDADSDDYDPDKYHYQKALYEDTIAFLAQHKTQLGQVRAQAQLQGFRTINDATRDAFIASVPDVADQAKAPAVFQDLIDYAVSLGSPTEVFQSPTTALEWHVLWKAREYDRLQQARRRVAEAPRPEPWKAQPAVRPGVTTPRGAIEQQKRGAALERLRREGSVDAGAAALKQLMKGKLS